MPPTQGFSSTKDESVYCGDCKTSYSSFIAFHNHKMRSNNHITCDVCSMDFNTTDAKKTHHDQLHSHEQNLKCPGCLKKFSRLGGLISHIELGECNSITKSKFDEAVREKAAWDHNYQQAHKFKDFGAGVVGPNPFAKPAAAGLTAEAFKPIQTPQPREIVFQGDDLISFDETSAILNSGWGDDYDAPTPILSKDDFPALGSATDPPRAKSKVKENTQLAGPIIAPLSLEERVTTMSISPSRDPHDPDNPSFDIQSYYIRFTGKYRCPFLGCNKSIDRPTAFIQHLKSPAHRNEKLQCNKCLRYFSTATALTQHSESQGVRCKVRQADNYAGIVDSITGGTATTSGWHVDNTIKYSLRSELESLDPAHGASGIIDANRRQGEAINTAKKQYWTKHRPNWG